MSIVGMYVILFTLFYNIPALCCFEYNVHLKYKLDKSLSAISFQRMIKFYIN